MHARQISSRCHAGSTGKISRVEPEIAEGDGASTWLPFHVQYYSLSFLPPFVVFFAAIKRNPKSLVLAAAEMTPFQCQLQTGLSLARVK